MEPFKFGPHEFKRPAVSLMSPEERQALENEYSRMCSFVQTEGIVGLVGGVTDNEGGGHGMVVLLGDTMERLKQFCSQGHPRSDSDAVVFFKNSWGKLEEEEEEENDIKEDEQETVFSPTTTLTTPKLQLLEIDSMYAIVLPPRNDNQSDDERRQQLHSAFVAAKAKGSAALQTFTKKTHEELALEVFQDLRETFVDYDGYFCERDGMAVGEEANVADLLRGNIFRVPMSMKNFKAVYRGLKKQFTGRPDRQPLEVPDLQQIAEVLPLRSLLDILVDQEANSEELLTIIQKYVHQIVLRKVRSEFGNSKTNQGSEVTVLSVQTTNDDGSESFKLDLSDEDLERVIYKTKARDLGEILVLLTRYAELYQMDIFSDILHPADEYPSWIAAYSKHVVELRKLGKPYSECTMDAMVERAALGTVESLNDFFVKARHYPVLIKEAHIERLMQTMFQRATNDDFTKNKWGPNVLTREEDERREEFLRLLDETKFGEDFLDFLKSLNDELLLFFADNCHKFQKSLYSKRIRDADGVPSIFLERESLRALVWKGLTYLHGTAFENKFERFAPGYILELLVQGLDANEFRKIYENPDLPISR